MSRKSLPKLRFIVEVAGEDREFAAVGVRKPDQLIITFPFPKNLEWEGADRKIVEDHFSVHGSNDRHNWTTIKRTIKSEDGLLLESVCQIDNNPQGWGAPIFFNLPPSLDNERYAVNAKPGIDEVMKVGSFDPKSHSFAYGIIVADGPWDLMRIGCHGVLIAYINLGRFSIGIVPIYLSIPSAPIGSLRLAVTNDLRINRGDVSPSEKLKWMDHDHVRNQIIKISGDLMKQQGERIIDKAEMQGVEAAWVRKNTLQFGSEPLPPLSL